MEERIQMSSSPTTACFWLFSFFSSCIQFWTQLQKLSSGLWVVIRSVPQNHVVDQWLKLPPSLCEILMPKQVSGLWFHGFLGLSHMSHFLVDWARSWNEFRTVCYIKFWDSVWGRGCGLRSGRRFCLDVFYSSRTLRPQILFRQFDIIIRVRMAR